MSEIPKPVPEKEQVRAIYERFYGHLPDHMRDAMVEEKMKDWEFEYGASIDRQIDIFTEFIEGEE